MRVAQNVSDLKRKQGKLFYNHQKSTHLPVILLSLKNSMLYYVKKISDFAIFKYLIKTFFMSSQKSQSKFHMPHG